MGRKWATTEHGHTLLHWSARRQPGLCRNRSLNRIQVLYVIIRGMRGLQSCHVLDCTKDWIGPLVRCTSEVLSRLPPTEILLPPRPSFHSVPSVFVEIRIHAFLEPILRAIDNQHVESFGRRLRLGLHEPVCGAAGETDHKNKHTNEDHKNSFSIVVRRWQDVFSSVLVK
jgi:hypothetical protein